MEIKKINKGELGLLILLLGNAGVGKTTQVYSLPEEEVLFINVEDGIRAIQNWGGDVIDVKCWNDIVMLASIIGGENKNLSTTNETISYSKMHFDNCVKKFPALAKNVGKYKYIFIDSITKLDFYSIENEISKGVKGFEKWGNHGDNMIGLFNQLRNSNKSIICTGGHQFAKNEETGAKEYDYLLSGKSAKFYIKHIFDNVITLVNGNDVLPTQTKFEKENPDKVDERRNSRFFVCRESNQWGFLAKERSEGLLGIIEEGNLYKFIQKTNTTANKPRFFELNCTPEEIKKTTIKQSDKEYIKKNEVK